MLKKEEPCSKNRLNSKKCPYSWKDTSINNKDYKQTCKQLDYCYICTRYFQCNKVLELNERLVELEDLDT